mgnify:CR=1 FL=1|tara:strand:+ start:6789 stop:7028 length:240 start_codon:yes stop_codon:yes gene_type:complete
MTDTFETTLVIQLSNENYWVRETAYIVNEMLHAIEQSKNPELTEKQRKDYARRATDLRLKAKECVHNAYNDSNNEEEKQ